MSDPILCYAFITGPNGVGMTDLNWLVNLLAGVVLTVATGINNHGQVIAVGENVPLVVPEPEIYAMLLAGLGLLGFIARRKIASAEFETRGRADPYCGLFVFRA